MRIGFLAFFFLLFLNVESQKIGPSGDLYTWFDSTVGEENAGLYQGLFYSNTDNFAKDSHPFFLTSNFLEGCLNYNGQKYCEINLKYDTYTDVLLTYPKGVSEQLVLELEEQKLEQFMIEGHQFKVVEVASKDEKLGICEVLVENDAFLLLKKHSKTRNQIKDNLVVAYKFEEKNKYYYQNEDGILTVNNKASITKIYPQYKKTIGSYFKTFKNLRATNRDEFYKLIFDKLYDSQSENPSKP